MFLFMLKKTFFDWWDNLFRMFFLNFGYAILAGSALLLSILFTLIKIPDAINVLITIIYAVFVFGVYNGAVHGMARDIADYKSPGFKDFFRHLKISLPVSIPFALLFSILIVICFFSIYSYNFIRLNVFLKLIAIGIIINVMLIVITASQYFLPIYFGLDKRFFKMIKKMFLIFFDNPLFSFSLLILSMIFLAISIASFMIIPGASAVPLLLNVGLKLRLYKYDYLEEHPDTTSSKIPWDALLIEDREKVGKRTLRGMIFPWKE